MTSSHSSFVVFMTVRRTSSRNEHLFDISENNFYHSNPVISKNLFFLSSDGSLLKQMFLQSLSSSCRRYALKLRLKDLMDLIAVEIIIGTPVFMASSSLVRSSADSKFSSDVANTFKNVAIENTS